MLMVRPWAPGSFYGTIRWLPRPHSDSHILVRSTYLGVVTMQTQVGRLQKAQRDSQTFINQPERHWTSTPMSEVGDRGSAWARNATNFWGICGDVLLPEDP